MTTQTPLPRPQDAKKNALKAGGATWAFASAMHL